MPEEVRKYKDRLDGRAMLVKKASVVPLEAIVRGYLSGLSSRQLGRYIELTSDQAQHGTSIRNRGQCMVYPFLQVS